MTLRLCTLFLVILASAACAPADTALVTTSTLVDPTPTANSTTEPDPVTTSVTTSTTEPVTTPSTTTSTTTTAALPAFPPGRENLTHGGDAWVVVLAASEDFEDPALRQAEADAVAAGYQGGSTDCDLGAAQALGLPGEDRHYYTVSVYLVDEADAQAALDAFRARGIDGAVGLVQTYCMD